MENNFFFNIKEVQSIKCKGINIPDERGFFPCQQVGQYEILVHGGCNSTKDYNQIHLLDLSIFQNY